MCFALTLNKAVEACLKALMYDETLAEAYAALGMAYFDKRMFDEALMAVKKAIEFDPGSFITYWIRGRIYHITDRDREAIEPYKKAVELNPNYYVVHMDLRTVYERLGEMDNYAAAVKAELQARVLAGEASLSRVLSAPHMARVTLLRSQHRWLLENLAACFRWHPAPAPGVPVWTSSAGHFPSLCLVY